MAKARGGAACKNGTGTVNKIASNPVPEVAPLDSENPWPGLESYREEHSAFFHGRDKERNELRRHIGRAKLTLFFWSIRPWQILSCSGWSVSCSARRENSTRLLSPRSWRDSFAAREPSSRHASARVQKVQDNSHGAASGGVALGIPSPSRSRTERSWR